MATVDTVGVKYEADLKALVSAQDKLIAENKAIAAGADKIGKEYTDSTKAASKGVDKLTKKTGELKKESGALQGTMAKVGSALVAAFAVERLISFGKQVLDVTGKFQRYAAVLTNTLGSTSEAQKALRMIQDFAAKTPFSVDELTGSFVKLANQGFQPTRTEMRKLGDLAASTGKSFDMLTEAIIDAQTGEFERLKEFGIRAQKEGDRVTFTFKGVQTQTDFTSESIQRYILGLGDLEGVSGGMVAISQTLEGQVSNLGDAWDSFMLSVGGAVQGEGGGLISALSASLSFLGDTIRMISDPVKYALDEAQKYIDEYQAATMEKAQEYTDRMTSIEVQGQIDRLNMQIAIRHAAFIKASSEGDEEAMKLANNMIIRYRNELKALEGIQGKKEESEVKAVEATEKKKAEEWAKGADKRKKAAEKLEQDLIKQEFDTQALRISLMDDGIEKTLLTLQLGLEKEKNAHRGNKEAILLLEQKFQQDLAAIYKAEYDKQAQERQGDLKTQRDNREKEYAIFSDLREQEFLAGLDTKERERYEIEKDYKDKIDKAKEYGLETVNLEKERAEKLAEIDKSVEDQKVEDAKKRADDRVAIEESSFAAISSIGNALIQDEMKRAQFQKAVSLFQIGVATAEAIAKGVASAQSVPFPGNLIAIAATVATVFANIATAKSILSSTPTPAYKDGVIDLQGPGTGTSDSIHARLSKGESVMTNRETAAYKDELMAIRKGQFEDMILSKYVLPALREDRKQKDMGSNLAKSLMLQSAFDDSGIIRAVEKNAPATAKDIKKQTRDLTRVFKDAAYIQTKKWRPNG